MAEMAGDVQLIAAMSSFMLGSTSSKPVRANIIYLSLTGKVFELADKVLQSNQPTVDMNSLMTDMAGLVFSVVDPAVHEVLTASCCTAPLTAMFRKLFTIDVSSPSLGLPKLGMFAEFNHNR